MTPIDLRLYAVADTGQLDDGRIADAVAAAIRGGATAIQLRDKRDDTRARIATAKALRAVVEAPVRLIVNDRVDVALASGADGVHLGRSDMTPEDARAILGPEAIVGITIHHAHEADATARVDYAGLGPAYATSSKDPGDPPLGPLGLARLVEAVHARLGPLPLCAIAGIDRERVPAVIGAGVQGVAVIGAVFRQPDIEAAARELRAAVDLALERRDGA
ncbi:MAG: thiamine phosphate synthase [Pseudomonadota bacterium]